MRNQTVYMQTLSLSITEQLNRIRLFVGSLLGIACLIFFSQIAFPALLLAQDAILDTNSNMVTARANINVENNPAIFTAALLIIFIIPIVSLGIISWFRYRKTKILCQTIDKMVENGLPIPDGLVPKSNPPHIQDRKKGILWIALGIGIMISILLLSPSDWSFSLIPIFLGAGYLISSKYYQS